MSAQAAINETRLSEGKPALPKEDLSKNSLFKSHSKPSRLDSVLLSNQISHFCKNLEHTSRLGLNKLYVTESLQEKVDANGE